MKGWAVAAMIAALGGCAGAPQQDVAPAQEQGLKKRQRLRAQARMSRHEGIRVAGVRLLDVPGDEVVAPGKVMINPNRISRVSLPVPGRVTEVAVRLGDSVTQGQELFRVESPEAEEAVSRAYQAEAAYSQARAALAKAQADMERCRDLYAHDAVAKKEVLNAEAELARAQASLKDAEAVLEQARRRLKILGLNGRGFGQQVVVRSPIAGKILDLQLVCGEYRNDTNTPVITVADLSSVWVSSAIPENSIRWIEPGERMRIELAAYPGKVYMGRVVRVADTVDPQTRTIEVLTELPNPDGRLRPEMFARIRHAHGFRRLPAVPSSAIVHRGGKSWVYVERPGGEYEPVAVKTAEEAEGMAPVLEGLKGDEQVVVDGVFLLQAAGGGR